MSVFAAEMTAWFEAMYDLAPVAVEMNSQPVRAVQDESQATDMLIAGGIQEVIEGAVFVLKAECAEPPKSKDIITVNARRVRIYHLHTEPADPTLRLAYGKL